MALSDGFVDTGVREIKKAKRGRYSATHERIRRFDSLARMAQYVSECEVNWGMTESENDDKASWSGAPSLRQAIDWAKNGDWPCPELPDLTAAYDEISLANVPQLTFASDVVGVRANVPAFVSGAPDAMYDLVDAEQPRRVIRILMGRTYSASVPARAIVEVSKRILAWIASIEMHSQISVEITLVASACETVCHDMTLCTIKRAGAPLDFTEIAYAMLSPAWLRRLWFRCVENLPREFQTYGYGSICDPIEEVLQDFDLFLPNIEACTEKQAWQEARKYVAMLNQFVEENL